MTRNSRYQNIPETSVSPTSLTKAGIYTRISVPDGDDVSESIANQIKNIMNYINHSEDLEYVKTYTDDGYTGQNFDRPGFRQMMQDIKAGLINCIIVKDNITIEFKHCSAKEISGMSAKTALVIQAIKALSKENLDEYSIQRIHRILSAEERSVLLKEAKYTTAWIYETIKNICATK